MNKPHEIINLVASIGVIVGLGFVAYELRQNNKIAYEDANSSISDKFLQLYENMSEPNNSELILKALEQQDELTRVEANRLSELLALRLEIYYYGVILQQQTGRTNEDFLGYLENLVPEHLDTSFGRAWWEQVRNNYPPEITAAVDRGLQNVEPDERLKFLDRIRKGQTRQ